MKSIKILGMFVGLMASGVALGATKTVYVPEPVIINSTKPCMIQIDKDTFINANHISSIYVGRNSYFDKEKSTTFDYKYTYKPAVFYVVGKSTHTVEISNPAAEQSRILELIQKTCK